MRAPRARGTCGRTLLGVLAAAAILAALPAAPAGAHRFNVGLLVPLSGPSAFAGRQMRDGFLLATRERDGHPDEESDGHLGGLDVYLLAVDHGGDPARAVAGAAALLARGDVDFVVGGVTPGVLRALHGPVTASRTFLIGAGAGPSALAGAGCDPFYFSVAAADATAGEALGRHAAGRGYRRVLAVTGDAAADDLVAGLRRGFAGGDVEVLRIGAGRRGVAAAIAEIEARAPDAVIGFLSEATGRAFVAQYRRTGAADRVPLLAAYDFTAAAAPGAPPGLLVGGSWWPGLDNAANRAFVRSFEAAYGYAPTRHAAEGYEAARLIDSAVRAVAGRMADRRALADALRRADFASVRGDLRFGADGFPVADSYLIAAGDGPGRPGAAVAQRVFAMRGTAEADRCPRK